MWFHRGRGGFLSQSPLPALSTPFARHLSLDRFVARSETEWTSCALCTPRPSYTTSVWSWWLYCSIMYYQTVTKAGIRWYVWDGDVRCVAANGLLELRLTWEQLSAGEPCPGWVRPCQGFRIDLPGLAIPFIQGVATDCGSYGCECNLLRVQRGARPGLFLLRGMRLPVFSVHRPNSWPSPGLARCRLRVRPGIPSSSIFPQPSRSSWIRIEVMLTTKRSARPWTVGWRKPVFDITPSTGADRSGQPARHAPRPCRPGGRRLVRRWTPEVIVNIASTWRRPTGWPARRTVRTATPGRVARWCSPDD